MPGMTMLPAVRDTAPDLSANEFEVEYIAEDGTRHRAPLADVRADARRGRPRRRTQPEYVSCVQTGPGRGLATSVRW